jgi:ribonuclease HI
VKINIYTDGSALGNPGPGGFGAIMTTDKGHYKELSQGFRFTTNNRMELLSVIVALETLKHPCKDVTVYSDSKYVVDAVEKKWVNNWERKNFANRKNPDLWKRFLRASAPHQVKFEWVKGHAGHVQNERCDQLAVNAAKQPNLPPDEGYETVDKSLF